MKYMKKNKRKGFVQISILAMIIVVIVAATTGVVLYRQAKINSSVENKEQIEKKQQSEREVVIQEESQDNLSNEENNKNITDNQTEKTKYAGATYIETTVDFNKPGEYKVFFEDVLASGKDFDCKYTPASTYNHTLLLKRKGNLLKTMALVPPNSENNLIQIAENDTKKTFTKPFKSTSEETGCNWIVVTDTGEPRTWGGATNYASFMMTFKSEYENGVITCGKPSFPIDEFTITGKVCPVEQVFENSIDESDIENFLNNLQNQ